MTEAAHSFTARRAVTTRHWVSWLVAWLLVADGLLSFAWWQNQRLVVRLPAHSHALQQQVWGPDDWTWQILSIGLFSAAGLRLLRVLAHIGRECFLGNPQHAERGCIGPVFRAELGKMAHALAALGFVMGAHYWTRLTVLLLVITAVATIALGLLPPGEAPPGQVRRRRDFWPSGGG